MQPTAKLYIPPSEVTTHGSVNLAPVPFLKTCTPESVSNPLGIASDFLNLLNAALRTASSAPKTVAELFCDAGYWRDHLCLSWDLRTMKGRSNIEAFLEAGCDMINIELDQGSHIRDPQITSLDTAGHFRCLQLFVKVQTKVGKGRGVMRAVLEPDPGSATEGTWKIYTLFTSLAELRGSPELTGPRRPRGAERIEKGDLRNWGKKMGQHTTSEDYSPTVLIVGAGQAGLSVAARLKMLGVEALLIDKAARVGDSWRNRYDGLVLHDPVWYDHMPYLPFPATWPIFTPKDKLADFFEAYVRILELDVWTSSMITSCVWVEDNRQWEVAIEQYGPNGDKLTRIINPRHVIQATGHSGKTSLPPIPGLADFEGNLLCHSSEFAGAKTLRERGSSQAIVIGSSNSAHDIAQNYYSKGYDVTMVQRSSALVVSSEALTNLYLGQLYSESGPPTEDADLLSQSLPLEIAKTQQKNFVPLLTQFDYDLLKGLDEVGFKLDLGPSCSGLLFKGMQRGGGYYIDVGASQLFISEKIRLKVGAEPIRINARSLTFSDGTELPADEIVFATGYQNMREESRSIFGNNIAEGLKDVWGLDEEGEMRGMWRPSGHPGFWFMGGNLALCRYFSRILALQIKAREAGFGNEK